MFKAFKPRKSQPPTVPTDQVVPLGWFDSTFFTGNAIIQSAFLFDNALDTPKLKNSLERLINRDGWRKLGSRLRRNPATGEMEFHIPAKYNAHRAAIKFHHIVHDMIRMDHPVASEIPRATTEPAVLKSPHDFEQLWQVDGLPTNVRDYLTNDEPLLTLIVVSFYDATLVCLNWPHFLCDAIGLGIILHAWSLELQGRGGEIPKPIGVDCDPLAEVGRYPTEQHTLEKSRLSTVGFLFWSLRHIPEILLRRKQQNRMVCIPGSYLQQIREEALRDLSADLNDERKFILSEGDVLSAWWAQVNSAYLAKSPKRLVSLINGLGWRYTDGLLPPEGPYFGNAVGMCVTSMPAERLTRGPLSYAASRVRQSITESRRIEQVEAYAALWRKYPARMNPIFGNTTMHLVTMSNWSKAHILDLDFSAAVVASVRDSSLVQPGAGRPSYTQSCLRGIVFPNFAIVHGKDAQGNYWLSNVTTNKHWDSIKEAIDAKIREASV